MRLIEYLREKKNNNFLIKKLFDLKHFLLHIYKVNKFEILVYNFYCKKFLNKKFEINSTSVSSKEKKIFEKENILIKKDYLNRNKLDLVGKSFNQNILNNNIVERNDLILSKPNFFKNVYFKYFLNTIIHEKFPLNWLNETSQIKNPLKNIKGLRELLQDDIFPIANSLLGCDLECFRCIAFRTKNSNKKETFNSQSQWHTDGDPENFLKFMLYLNDVDDYNGPFTYKKNNFEKNELKVTGSAGTSIFFRSSKLLHKGSNTINNYRDSIIFLFIPSKKNKIHEYEARPDYIRKFIPYFSSTKKARYFD